MSWFTEEEAKKKWCPMARVVTATEDGGDLSFDGMPNFNRVCLPGSVFLHASCLCVGSQCAMWIWERSSYREGFGRCGLSGIA